MLILVSAVVAGLFGFSFSGEWDGFLRLVPAQDFGTSDPIYLRDIGFYLFVLPFLNFVQNSLVLLHSVERYCSASHIIRLAVSD